MTKKEAEAYLKDLIDENKLQYSVYENEIEFAEAIEFVAERDYFNFEEFIDSKTIIRFGIWRVENYGLIADKQKYAIEKTRFWETREIKGKTVWDWHFHLIEKDWGIKNIQDFNIAFVFCQDYFKGFKPSNSKNASISQTLYIQKQYIDILNEFEEKKEKKKRGLSPNDIEYCMVDVLDPDFTECMKKLENIKSL